MKCDSINERNWDWMMVMRVMVSVIVAVLEFVEVRVPRNPFIDVVVQQHTIESR